MDEELARKYCLDFRKHPSLTISQIYRDCTVDSIAQLSQILADWCYIASENDIALLDHRIPMSYLQLYQFAHDIGSRNKNEKIVYARCRITLSTQSSSKESLCSLVKILRTTETSVDVFFYRAVVHLRLGDLQSAVQHFINGSMNSNSTEKAFCSLFSFSLDDLTLMKSSLVSLQTSIHGQDETTSGITNGGFVDDNESLSSGIGSSVVSLEIDQQKEKYILKDVQKSISLLDSVIECKMGKTLSTLELVSLLVRQDNSYKAVCTLIENFKDCSTISRIHQLDDQIRCSLFEFSRSVASSLLSMFLAEEQNSFTVQKKEDKYGHGMEDPQLILSRGLAFSRLAVALEPTNENSMDLLVRFLLKTGEHAEAIQTCQSNLTSTKKSPTLSLALAWCYFHEERMDETEAELDFVLEEAQVTEALCLKIILKLLNKNCQFPFNDLSTVCKGNTSDLIQTAWFAGKERLKKIKSNLCQMIPVHLSSFTSLVNPVSVQTVKSDSEVLHESDEGRQTDELQSCDSRQGFSCPAQDETLTNFRKSYRQIVKFLTRLFPLELDIHLLCSDILMFMKNYDQAQQCLIDLVKKTPRDLLTMVHLANLRMRLGAYVAATEDFRLLLQVIGPSRLAAYLLYLTEFDRHEIARVHRQHAFKYLKKDCSYLDAIECFTVAITAVGTMATGLLLARAICHAHLKYYKEALCDFNTILIEDKNSVSALIGKAIMLSLSSDKDSLLLETHHALQLDISVAIRTAHKLPLHCVQTYTDYIRQVIRSELRKYHDYRNEEDKHEVMKLAACANLLRSLFPQSQEDFLTLIECLFHCGEKKMALNELESDTVLPVSKGVVQAWKGILYYRMSKFQDAVAALKKVKETDVTVCRKVVGSLRITERKQLRSICLKEATDLQKRELFEEAVSMYRVALLTTQRKDLQVYRSRLECFCALEDTTSAISELDEIIKITSNVEDICKKAILLNDIGRTDLACEDFARAVDLNARGTLQYLTKENQLPSAISILQAGAQSCLQSEKFLSTVTYCECGLKLSRDDKQLKQLRARAKHKLVKCCVQ